MQFLLYKVVENALASGLSTSSMLFECCIWLTYTELIFQYLFLNLFFCIYNLGYGQNKKNKIIKSTKKRRTQKLNKYCTLQMGNRFSVCCCNVIFFDSKCPLCWWPEVRFWLLGSVLAQACQLHSTPWSTLHHQRHTQLSLQASSHILRLQSSN